MALIGNVGNTWAWPGKTPVYARRSLLQNPPPDMRVGGGQAALPGVKWPSCSSVDRQRGTLLGLAVGDALGAAVEFKSPGTFPEVTGYRGGGPHGLATGAWTDDTSMALALADSIASVGWDLNDQARRYLAWWRKGEYSVNGHCFDIGITTQSALRRFEKTGDARTSGDPSEQRQRQRLDHAAGPGADPLRRSVSPTTGGVGPRTASNPASPPMPAPSACRPAPTWAWCWRH